MSATSLLRTLGTVISKRNNISSLRNVSSVCFTKINGSCPLYFTNPHNLFVGQRMMATVTAFTNIGIDELKTYQKNKDATIIDVREIDEIKETGLLPGGINIPLGEVAKALQEDPKTFKLKYKHDKPTKNCPIVFSCRSGKRSSMAAQTAESLGYKNVINFAGGWIEWENHLPK